MNNQSGIKFPSDIEIITRSGKGRRKVKTDSSSAILFQHGASWMRSEVLRLNETKEVKTKEEQIKEIAYIAWKGAANAYRMYPDNRHTFAEFWDSSKEQFNQFHPPIANKNNNEDK